MHAALASQGRIPLPTWVGGAVFIPVYVLLDWASYLRPLVEGFNITPWNPQQALAVALLLWRRSAAWFVFAAAMASEVLVRGWRLDEAPIWLACAASTLVFQAIATALGRRRDPLSHLESRAALLRFAAVVTGGSLATAFCYVTILSPAPAFSDHMLASRIASYWVGDSVGLLVTLPLLLAGMARTGRAALWDILRRASWWVAVAATAAGLWIVFGVEGRNHFKFFYLLMLPVVWCSVRFGVAGAVLSTNVTQVGLLMASQQTLLQDLAVFELQGLMAAATATALLLGVLVDERARAEAEVRKALRFSAAGQMAAGLAHELGQPLTAMNNFGEACRMLLEREPVPRQQFSAAIERMLAEGARAAEVARRLRDFFGSGAMSMRMTDVAPVLEQALQEQRAAAERAGVRLHARIEPRLPQVWMDPVQVAIVLRNLLANAIESAPAGGGPAEVVLGARVDDGALRIDVHDSGPGVSAGRVRTLFDATASDKLGGMGVGLSICHSIVEAHSGDLWAEPGPGGRLSFTLPLETTETA